MITAQKIHVVGIGGIGVSALSRLLQSEGKQVSGSDLTASEITQDLQKQGVQITLGHRERNLPRDAQLAIYSVAVSGANPELELAKKLNIPRLSYPKALGEFAADKKIIAVAGTNGKTTTTAMIATVLEAAGYDPAAIVGSKVLAWNSNARAGKGKYLILEADEYRRAFLNYQPDMAVITNIEADHLDYFLDLEDVKRAFSEFENKIKPGGSLIYNLDDQNTVSVASGFIGKKIGFRVKDYRLQVPGKFNQANAAAAVTACEVLGIPREQILKSLANFTGTSRRFEKIGKLGNTLIISDYAHHPRGVTVTLQTMYDVYEGKRILAVFQPHQHNRTKNLFSEFVRSFCNSPLHNFIISEIFEVAGREAQADQDISSQDLVREIEKCGKEVVYAKDLEDCEQKIRDRLSFHDAVIIMGAGDIYKVAIRLAGKQA